MLQRLPGKPESPSTRRKRRQRLRQSAARLASKRKHRQRVKAGRMVVPVEVDGQVLSWLIRIHRLTEAEADQGDARLIGQAIAAGLAASAK
jgi:hypothetical protein